MKQLLDFIPLILFFITYKLGGVREAAIVLVVATILQIVILKWKYGMVENNKKIMASAVVFFGLLTAYFNEIRYLQWKVTIINGLFAIVLLVAQFQFKTPLIKKSYLVKSYNCPKRLGIHLTLAGHYSLLFACW